MLNKEHYQILKHTLGLDQKRTAYRNHFCAEEGHADMPLLVDLMKAGFMVKAESQAAGWNRGFDVYRVTREGKAALKNVPVQKRA